MITPEAKAVGAGIYGKVAGVTYGGNFAMNLKAPEATEGESRQNTVFDANVAFDVGPLKLDGKYIRQAENFVATADVHAFNSIEAGVATDFLLGIDLGGRFYRKSTGEEANEEVLNAYLLTAKKKALNLVGYL